MYAIKRSVGDYTRQQYYVGMCNGKIICSFLLEDAKLYRTKDGVLADLKMLKRKDNKSLNKYTVIHRHYLEDNAS